MKAVGVNHLYRSYADVTAVNDLTFALILERSWGFLGRMVREKATP